MVGGRGKDRTFAAKNKIRMKKIITAMLLMLPIGALAQNGEARQGSTEVDSLMQTLPEVMVKGERPIVKADGAKLVYDLPRLIQGTGISNAYDAVKELPGVVEMQESLTLGGQPVTVIIDEKVQTLTKEQLYGMLKAMPASRIAKAEVLYNAPARYQVRGAVINIVLKHNGIEALQGELYGGYAQKHEAMWEERASIAWSKGKLTTDLLYDHEHGRTFTTDAMEARHMLADGSLTPIVTDRTFANRSHTHSMRLGMDYDFAEQHRLSAVYYDQYATKHGTANTTGDETTNSLADSEPWLHDLRLDYRTPFGLKAGAEYTYYNMERHQLLESHLLGTPLSFTSDSRQHIDKWKAFIGQEHQLKQGWSLNYGIIYNHSRDHSYQRYANTSEQSLLPFDSERNEQTLNLYAGFSKSFGTKFSLDASLAAERFKNPEFDRWDWYPDLTLMYRPADLHLLQLTVSSDKTYPQYWEMQRSTSYISGYEQVVGNPQLQPSRSYATQLLYMLRNKYIVALSFSHLPDYFVQTLYQSPTELHAIYQSLNFNYMQQTQLMLSAPLKIGRWLSSNATLIGVHDRIRCDHFHDLSFDRSIWGLYAILNNTVSISDLLKLKAKLFYRTKGHQALYDLPASFTADFDLTYTFNKNRATLTAYVHDLFETGGINPRMDYQGQWQRNTYSCYRELGLKLSLRFNNYKEKQRQAVDTSRFK